MKKISLALLLIVSVATTGLLAKGHNNHRVVNKTYVTVDNTTHNAITNKFYEGVEEERVSMAALSSVELNPDHKGWSAGVGASTNGGMYAGALGVMYGFDNDTGLNVKAYQAEGGYNGASIGFTIGF